MIAQLSRALASNAPALVGVALRATIDCAIVFAMALGAARLLRRHSAAVRHLLWVAAIAAIAATPVATWLLPEWRVTMPALVARASVRVERVFIRQASNGASPRLSQPVSVNASALGEHAGGRTAVNVAPGSDGRLRASARPGAGQGTSRSWAAFLVLCWVLIGTALFVRIVLHWVAVVRLVSGAAAVRDEAWLAELSGARQLMHVRRVVRLAVTDAAQVPMTCGIMHPTVILPPDYAAYAAGRRAAVLRHELAHVARFDAVTHLAARVCCALNWFNPFIWIAARRLRIERERACDDRVLASGTSATNYAADLLDFARKVSRGTRHGAALAMAERSHLEGRLTAILDGQTRRNRATRLTLVVACASTMALVPPLAAFRPVVPPVHPPIPSNAQLDSSVSIGVHTPAVPAPMRRASVPERQPMLRTVSIVAARAELAGDSAMLSLPADDGLCEASHRARQHSSGYTTFPDLTYWLDRASGGMGHARSPGLNGIHVRNWKGSDCSGHWSSQGIVTMNADFSEIVGVVPDSQLGPRFPEGFVQLSVRTGTSERRLNVWPPGGPSNRSYTVNGRVMAYDDSARAWVAAALVEFDRESATAVDVRLPLLLRRGGASGVLNEIGHITDDFARGVYLLKLIETAALADSEVRRTARLAAEISSDYGILRVLDALCTRFPARDAETQATLFDMARFIEGRDDREYILNKIANSIRR